MDGWLGFLVGSELWYPLYDKSYVPSTASNITKLLHGESKYPSSNKKVNVKSLKSIVAFSRKRSSNANATDGFPLPLAPQQSGSLLSQSESSHANSPSSPSADYETAWSLLVDDHNVLYPKALHALLDDLCLVAASDLQAVADNLLVAISATLKPVPKRKFLESLQKSGVTVRI